MRRREFIAGLAAAAATPAAEKTTAEQLGYGPQEKLLMVHADDAGMCHSVNIATSEALASGSVQSASIMVPCPWFTEMAEVARQHPEYDLGLHLTLTSEWKYYRWRPVAPPEKVKGLLDPDGYIWRDVLPAASHATPAEVETELRAQIERARQFGIKFTHVDTHMGTCYARPDFFDVYTRVAKEAGVVCMMPRPTEAARKELSQYPITEAMLRAKEREGFVLLDRLVTGVEGKDRNEAYRKFLRELQPGVTKLIVHLSKDDPEIRAVTNAWAARWGDFQFWTSAEAKGLLRQYGIKAMTYREMGKLLRG